MRLDIHQQDQLHRALPGFLSHGYSAERILGMVNANRFKKSVCKAVFTGVVHMLGGDTPDPCRHKAQDCFGAFTSWVGEHHLITYDWGTGLWVLTNEVIQYTNRYGKLEDALNEVYERSGVRITGDYFFDDDYRTDRKPLATLGYKPEPEPEPDPVEKPETFGSWS